MIVDSIKNLRNYISLNPRIALVADFIETHDLAALPLGRNEISGDDAFVMVSDAPVRKPEEAPLESHRRMVDIQVAISGPETHGFRSLCGNEPTPYDEANDIAFHPLQAQTYFTVQPNQFVIYFPADGHAPAITPEVLRKAIFKIKK